MSESQQTVIDNVRYGHKAQAAFNSDMDEARLWARQGASESEIAQAFGASKAELALGAEGRKKL